MAYAAIMSLKLTLQQNILLNPFIFVRPCEKKHIESFHEKLEFLQRFLEEHPSHESSEEVTFLERRIRDAAHEAEDSMDLHLIDLHNSEEKIWQMEIKPMVKQVDSIIGEVTKIKLGRGSFMEKKIKTVEFSKHKDSSSATKNLMVGFDDYLMQIKDQLTGQSYTREVISIVGMGGIGKTTLAANVYNDPYVVNHFDIRAWVTISQSYSVRDILLGMLDSMGRLTKEMHQERDDRLGLHVYQNLKNRRYLIIIDDIWDTNAWDNLKMMFPDDEMGSRIMLTTRIADVAAHADQSGTRHQISLLSNDQSWKLLCAKVFGDELCPLSLQEIGKSIARNCRGLPLAIVVIGGLLSKVEKTQTAWQPIAENVTSIVFSSDDQCSAIIRLSYNYLPQYLKACFLYMGIFPKRDEIRVSNLTKMWIAEGFLRQTDGQSPEELAERCVEDLFDRSLILMSKNNYEGKIKAFRIHDLLVDFCVKEAKDEKFLRITESPTNLVPTSSASERRISIHPVEKFEYRRFHSDSMLSSSYVRSLVSWGKRPLSSDLFLRFKLLRVLLDATEFVSTQFPSKVLELLNLRYLALSCDEDIPASITKLWNLQTLIIVRNISKGIRDLPVGIWIMEHLRHVSCEGYHLLHPTTAKFDFYGKRLVLENLQSLSGLWNLIFDEKMLQSIPNIKKIVVYYESGYLLKKEWLDNQLENLHNLLQLKALKIRVLPVSYNDSNWPPKIFKFRFPPSLKTLTLYGVGIPWDDLAIIGSLPNLRVLKLTYSACVGTEWEPNEGEFCKLKVLVLEFLKLEHWRADSNHFPSLERLIIRMCKKLVEIPSGLGESPTLTMIELDGCKGSVWDSANEILEKQRDYGNDGFQVIHAVSKAKRYGLLESLWRRKLWDLLGRTMPPRKEGNAENDEGKTQPPWGELHETEECGGSSGRTINRMVEHMERNTKLENDPNQVAVGMMVSPAHLDLHVIKKLEDIDSMTSHAMALILDELNKMMATTMNCMRGNE